jgi:hypothetical protein
MTSMLSQLTPERSLQQRLDSLRKANGIRSDRAQLKRDLKAGRKRAVDLLIDPPEWLATMKVFDLLLAVPKYGRVKASKALSRARISPSKTIGGMTRRQRAELVAATWPRELFRIATATECTACGGEMLAPNRDGVCGLCIEEIAA